MMNHDGLCDTETRHLSLEMSISWWYFNYEMITF